MEIFLGNSARKKMQLSSLRVVFWRFHPKARYRYHNDISGLVRLGRERKEGGRHVVFESLLKNYHHSSLYRSAIPPTMNMIIAIRNTRNYRAVWCRRWRDLWRVKKKKRKKNDRPDPMTVSPRGEQQRFRQT